MKSCCVNLHFFLSPSFLLSDSSARCPHIYCLLQNNNISHTLTTPKHLSLIMQFSLLPFSLFLSVTAAATSSLSASATGTSTACAAQDVLDQCLVTGKGYLDACAASDYACLCQKSNDILTCYLQCPNDPGQSSAQNTKDTNCNNASIYGQTTSAISRPVSSSASATGATTEASATSNSGAAKTASGTSSGASSSATGKTNAAENLVVGAGSVMMGLAAVVAAVL